MEQIIKAIIVDDEQEAIDFLSDMLKDFNSINCIGKFQNVTDAVDYIIKNPVDLVFLDIDMPGKTGFDLLDDLKEKELNPEIIFVTAFNEYAIKAFKYAAFDYLPKPIDKDDLTQSLARLRTKVDKNNLCTKINLLYQKLNSTNKFRINTRAGYILVDLDDILYCEADDCYTRFHMTSNEKLISSKTLGQTEQEINSANFIRVSRKYLINKSFLHKVDTNQKLCILNFNNYKIELKATRQGLNKLV